MEATGYNSQMTRKSIYPIGPMYGMFTNMFQKKSTKCRIFHTGHMDPMGIWNGISVNLHTNIHILTFAFHPGDITLLYPLSFLSKESWVPIRNYTHAQKEVALYITLPKY